MNTNTRTEQVSKQAVTVSELNNYIKKMFAQDYLLRKIYVKGEVSNLKYHSSGHIYFSLKDDNGLVSCIMFAGSRKGLSFRLEEGQQIIVGGTVDTYEALGKYQLYAREIFLDGLGSLYEKFNELKNRLSEMGMFAPEYKKPIPSFCRRIGIVTSPTGAAIRDIESVARSRNPYVELILYPALVQGEGAAQSIVKGIQTLNKIRPDVIIIGRGGGSIEDLWAFNEETVAEAIFASEVPIISAVGHETDFTISDFTADLRVPTPTAAAQAAVPDIRLLLNSLNDIRNRLENGITDRIQISRDRIAAAGRHLNLLKPADQIRRKQETLLYASERLNDIMRRKISDKRSALSSTEVSLKACYDNIYSKRLNKINVYIARLDAASPLKKLSQGFSYTCNSSGRAVTSLDCVEIGEKISINVSDGIITGTVDNKTKLSFATGLR